MEKSENQQIELKLAVDETSAPRVDEAERELEDPEEPETQHGRRGCSRRLWEMVLEVCERGPDRGETDANSRSSFCQTCERIRRCQRLSAGRIEGERAERFGKNEE